jgi:hypothetical protein
MFSPVGAEVGVPKWVSGICILIFLKSQVTKIKFSMPGMPP